MRQKMITLCPTTWEKAAKMKNFSGWVRSKIKEEMQSDAIAKQNAPEFWAYCAPCDLSATGKNKYMLEYKYCPKCHSAMEFMGVVE
jgi:hypothetical protein